MDSPEGDPAPEDRVARLKRAWSNVRRSWSNWWRSWPRIEPSRLLDAGRSGLSRASAIAAEAWHERRRVVSERSRVGAIVAAGLICLVVVAAVVAWPALVGGLSQARRAVSTPVPRQEQARAPAGTPTGHSPTHRPTASPTPGSAGVSPTPQPVTEPAPQPPQQPPPQQPPPQQPPPTQQVQQNTPPGSQIVGGSQAGSGWQYHNGGGYSGCDTCFGGWMAWVNGPTSDTVSWSQTVTSSNVHVAVWVPNFMAGAVVSYTVTGTQQYGPFQITQEWVSGWQTLPGTFASSGTTTVMMHYVAIGHPQATPDPACTNNTICSAMAAAQVKFWWS